MYQRLGVLKAITNAMWFYICGFHGTIYIKLYLICDRNVLELLKTAKELIKTVKEPIKTVNDLFRTIKNSINALKDLKQNCQ